MKAVLRLFIAVAVLYSMGFSFPTSVSKASGEEGLWFHNSTNFTIWVAFRYYPSMSTYSNVTRGWLRIEPGDTKLAVEQFNPDMPIHYYAESNNGLKWQGNSGYLMWVSDLGFRYTTETLEDTDDSFYLVPINEIDTDGQSGLVENILIENSVPSPQSVVSAYSGRCLELDTGAFGNAYGNGGRIQQWGCWGGSNQQWHLEPYGYAYRIVSEYSGKCLDLDTGSDGNPYSNGGRIQQWICLDGLNQQWRIEPVGNSYQIISVYSGKCLDLDTGSLGNAHGNGGRLQQWDCWGGQNQLWSFDSSK